MNRAKLKRAGMARRRASSRHRPGAGVVYVGSVSIGPSANDCRVYLSDGRELSMVTSIELEKVEPCGFVAGTIGFIAKSG